MATADLPGPTWRKSSYSGNNANCVEIGRTPTRTSVRDTKDRDGASLQLACRSFDVLLTHAASHPHTGDGSA